MKRILLNGAQPKRVLDTEGNIPFDAWPVTSMITRWTPVSGIHRNNGNTCISALCASLVCAIWVFYQAFNLDNGTLCFQYLPCRASVIKSAKHAGPDYALPLTRCAVGKRGICLNCTTESKHPVFGFEQAVLKCCQLSSDPTVLIMKVFWLIYLWNQYCQI